MGRNALAVMILGLCAVASAAQEPEEAQTIWYLPPASDALDRLGIVRVINYSGEAGEVRIDAIDDEGQSYGPATLSIGAGETTQFNSHDLEDGNADRGLSDGVGADEGEPPRDFRRLFRLRHAARAVCSRCRSC